MSYGGRRAQGGDSRTDRTPRHALCGRCGLGRGIWRRVRSSYFGPSPGMDGLRGRLSGFAVSLIVKRHAGAAGLQAAGYSGHSLRAGLTTSAAIAGASERSIMAQTDTSRARWFDGTSGIRACSRRMRRRGWGCRWAAVRPGTAAGASLACVNHQLSLVRFRARMDNKWRIAAPHPPKGLDKHSQ